MIDNKRKDTTNYLIVRDTFISLPFILNTKRK